MINVHIVQYTSYAIHTYCKAYSIHCTDTHYILYTTLHLYDTLSSIHNTVYTIKCVSLR